MKCKRLVILFLSVFLICTVIAPVSAYSYGSYSQYQQQTINKAIEILERAQYHDYLVSNLVDQEYIRQGLAAVASSDNYRDSLNTITSYGASKTDRIIAQNNLLTILRLGLIGLLSSPSW